MPTGQRGERQSVANWGQEDGGKTIYSGCSSLPPKSVVIVPVQTSGRKRQKSHCAAVRCFLLLLDQLLCICEKAFPEQAHDTLSLRKK